MWVKGCSTDLLVNHNYSKVGAGYLQMPRAAQVPGEDHFADSIFNQVPQKRLFLRAI